MRRERWRCATRASCSARLSVTKRRGEALTPIEQKLVDDLAHQAGLVLKNVGLSADLQARLDELRASRQRLVSAQDLERRRLERNLHDGAQQHLVALKVKLGLAEMLLSRDPEKAAATLDAAEGRRRRSTGDAARPGSRDLPAAARRQGPRRRPRVPGAQGDGAGGGRMPRAWSGTHRTLRRRCTSASSRRCRTCRSTRRHHMRWCVSTGPARSLRFVVEDDGKGFDPATVRRGAGLTNMSDRIDAVGGSLTVSSTPGSGTTMSADDSRRRSSSGSLCDGGTVRRGHVAPRTSDARRSSPGHSR